MIKFWFWISVISVMVIMGYTVTGVIAERIINNENYYLAGNFDRTLSISIHGMNLKR